MGSSVIKWARYLFMHRPVLPVMFNLTPNGVRVGFPGGSVVKKPPANAGNLGSIPGLGRSPGERNVNRL